MIHFLPDSIGNLRNLKELDLSDNRGINNISATASQLQGLEKVNLSRTGLPKLPNIVSTWKNLKELSFRDLILSDTNLEMKDLDFLERVDIRELGIERLPESIASFTKITHFNAKNNNLVDSGIPMSISKWSFCIHLNLE